MRVLTACEMLVLLACGCSEKGPTTAQVSGVVTYKGEPVQHAKVLFFPQNIPDGRMAIAQADAEGRFNKVITPELTNDGAVVGTHIVTVTESWPADQEIPLDAMGMQKSPPRGPWAQKYRDSASGALKVDVIAGQENQFKFELSE